MLVNAYQLENKIRDAMFPLWYDEEYQWFFAGRSHTPYSLYEYGDAKGRHFASVDSAGGLVGIIGYKIHEDPNAVAGLYILRFPGTSKAVFGRDLLQAVDDVFRKFGHNRLSYGVVIGNPAERMYDRWTARLGGRTEGLQRQAATNLAGNLCDFKEYAILREEYIQPECITKKEKC